MWSTRTKRRCYRAAYWDAEGHRTPATIARSAEVLSKLAGFSIPAGKTFPIVPEEHIGRQHVLSEEKLGIVAAIFKYTGWDQALNKVRQVFETGGKGHSGGIYLICAEERTISSHSRSSFGVSVFRSEAGLAER